MDAHCRVPTIVAYYICWNERMNACMLPFQFLALSIPWLYKADHRMHMRVHLLSPSLHVRDQHCKQIIGQGSLRRRRWRLVSAQLSIKFRYCPSYTVSIVLSLYQRSSYLLGRYESSSLVSYRSPCKGIVNYADILMCELSDFIKLHSTQMAR